MAEFEATPDSSDTDSDEELFKRLKRWFREDSEHWSKWREEAHEDYAFVANEQWSDEDRRVLTDNLRPVITFNRIDALIRSVSGEQINNQQEVRYLPREMGDAKANELLTSAAMWFRDQCDADDEESEAFWDAAICGFGWVESRLDLEEDPEEPAPLIERIDPFEIVPDCHARKRNLSDARRIFRVKSNIPIEEAEELYPDAAKSDLDAGWARLGDMGKIADQAEADRYEPNIGDIGVDSKKDTVTQVQCQWWERKTFYKALDPFTGETVDLDEDEHRKLTKRVKELAGALSGLVGEEAPPELAEFLSRLKDGGLQSLKLKRRVYKQAFLGRIVLKVKDSPCPDHFTFNCVTGFRDRNKGHFYGLVRSMKDPQRWANKWLSQTLHIMNTSAKGGVFAERTAVESVKQFEDTYAKNDQVTWVEDGANTSGRIIPKPGGNFPAGFFQLMEFAISSIRDVAGINLEMLGMREAGQAASLEYQRRQAGITILATLFRSMRRYHRNQGKVLLYFIQHHLSDGRLIRIIGDEGAQYVPLIKQADGKYDIVVDEGPTSPNQKERVWSLIGEAFWKLPPPIQLALLEYSPFPESVVQKIKESAKQASEGPAAELQQKMMQLEAKLKEVEVMAGMANVEKTKAETAKVASELGQNGSGGEHQQHMAELATETQLKREGAAQDAELQREGMGLDMQKHRESLGAEAAMGRERLAAESEQKRQDREAQLMGEFAQAVFQPPEPKRAA